MVTVDELLEKPFLSRPSAEQLKIILEGKPRPVLQNVAPSPKHDGKFDATFYDREHWLTGCEKRQGLFCWPCLLFVSEHQSWNTTGYQDLRHIYDGVVKHKKTMYHVQGMLSLQLFLHEHLFPINNQSSVKQHNEVVKRNRDLVKRIIDVICCTAAQQSPPCKGTNDYNKFNRENCIEALRMLRNYDVNNVTDEAISLIEKTPNVLTDMISIITTVVKQTIKKDTQASTYVSIVLNEHSDIDLKSQLSTVLRFLKDGKVCERFVGFTNINEYKTANVIHKHIATIVKDYEIAERFLAHAVDGAVLASSQHLKNLKKKLRDEYPYSFFVPCYYHELDFIIEQSLSRIKDCELFFKKVNSVKEYFRRNSKACTAFNNLSNESIFNVDEVLHTSDFIRILKTHRRKFVTFFEFVVENFEEWTPSEIAEAFGFQEILKEFNTIFLLEIFFKVFYHSTTLYETLASHLPEAAFGSNIIEELKKSLENQRENGFEDLWVLVIAEILGTEEQKPKSLKDIQDHETKLLHREFYFKVIDCVILEIDIRFSDMKDLMFFHILNYEKHGKFVIANEPLQSLLAVHGPYFDESWMKNEMKVLCTNGAVFAKKTVYELMEIFITANLREAFKYLFKLAELILTMPCKPPSLANESPKLDQISVWSNTSENQESASTDWNFLCVEQEYVEELRNSSQFHDDVITKFQEINSLPLSFC